MAAAIAEGKELYRYLPQRPPILLIDALLRNGEDGTETSFKVPEVHLFLESGSLREGGLMENIAQTAAAGVGHHFVERTEKGEVPLGFIAAVKEMSFHRLPRSAQLLHTYVKVKQEVMNMSIVEGKLYCDQELLAEGELRIFLQEE